MVLDYQSNKLTWLYTNVINICSDMKYVRISKFVQCIKGGDLIAIFTWNENYVGKRQNWFSTNANVTIYNYL